MLRLLRLCCPQPTRLLDVVDVDVELSDHPEAPSTAGAGKKPLANEGHPLLSAKTVAALSPLDSALLATLEQGDIALVRTESLLKLSKLPYRQQLEVIDPTAFMPPAEAAALLRSGTRAVGALTYGWGCGGDCDPDGAYLRSVQAALRTEELAHIEVLFWDYPSLFQHPPGGRRTPKQEAAFVRVPRTAECMEGPPPPTGPCTRPLVRSACPGAPLG